MECLSIENNQIISKLFYLLDKDVFYQLAQLDITMVSPNLFESLIAIFDQLADFSFMSSILSNFYKTTICINFLLIGFTKYNNLSSFQFRLAFDLVLKLSNLLFVRIELLVTWLVDIAKLPDSMYYLSRNHLLEPKEAEIYLPIYELLKEFISMDASLRIGSLTGLHNLVSSTNDSCELQSWLTASDLPSTMTSWLFEVFLESSHNSMTSIHDESGINNFPLDKLDHYLVIITSIIANSKFIPIKWCLLDNLKVNFLTKLVESYYIYNCDLNYQIDICILLNLFIIRILEFCDTDNELTKFLIEITTESQQLQLIHIYRECLLNENSGISILALELINTLFQKRNAIFIQHLFFTEYPNKMDQEMSHYITENDQIRINCSHLFSNDEVFMSLEKIIDKIKSQGSVLSNAKFHISDKKILPVTLYVLLANFFHNNPNFNSKLIEVWQNLLCFSNFHVVDSCYDEDYEISGNFSDILTFLFSSYHGINLQLSFTDAIQDKILVPRPDASFLDGLPDDLIRNIQRYQYGENISKSEVVMNQELFKSLYSDVYCIRMIMNNVRHVYK